MCRLVDNFQETIYSKGKAHESLSLDINFCVTRVYRSDAPVMAHKDSKSSVRCRLTSMDADNILLWNLNILDYICMHQVK